MASDDSQVRGTQAALSGPRLGWRERPTVWPRPPAEEARHGVAGEIARLVDSHSEADPTAVLVQTLVAFGALAGRGPSFQIERTRHGTNEFVVLVGATSKARKGTSLGHVEDLIAAVEPRWSLDNVHSGLASGEGLGWAVRDPIDSLEPVRQGGRVVRYERVRKDPGVDDKRLLVVESEFASPLKVMRREGNQLSGVLRQAWDGRRLENMSKSSPSTATDPHVALIAHITQAELGLLFDAVEMANGFGNRFLWCAVRRSGAFPHGGSVPAEPLAALKTRLAAIGAHARTIGTMTWSAAGRGAWSDVYAELTRERPGLVGSLLSRSEAHVLRLSMIYALLDGVATIEPVHVAAARAVWRYVEDSVDFIFGALVGDPVADRILESLRASPLGMSRTKIRDLFRRHRSDEIAPALGRLLAQHLARYELDTSTGGRPEERWFATSSSLGRDGVASPSSGASTTADATLPSGS